MKPIKKQAILFAQSMRGQYIISQAPYYAIKELEKVKQPHKEESNIADMKFLMNDLFNIFAITHDAEILFRKKLKKEN